MEKVHPVAALFPMMSDEELDTLAEDIKANGQLHPVIYDAAGQLIDGRNRLAACKRAGVKPKIDTLAEGVDPVAFILSANVNRRHMSKGQASMAVAKAGVFLKNTGMRDLARSSGMSASRVAYAAVVLEYAEELADAVLAGATPLNVAYETARARKQSQESMLEQERRIQYEREQEAKRAQKDLLKLQKDAPDLADLVIEERMSLGEAQAAFKRRQEEEIRDRRVLSENLAMALAALDPGQVGVEATARHFMLADVSFVGFRADFSAERIRKVLAVLSAWLTMKEQGNESEAA